MKRVLVPCTVAGLLVLCALCCPHARAADQPWEEEVRAAARDEDRMLDEASRNRTTAHVVSRYQSRLDRQPSATNHYLLGRALYYHRDLPAAQRALTKALEIDPRFWFARLGLALLALERGDLVAARQQIDEATRARSDDADVLKLRARILMESKDWDGAIAALRPLIAAEPGKDELRKMSVACSIQKKDWPTVIRELEMLEARLPRDPFVRTNLALALLEAGRLDDAARKLEVAVRGDPTDIRSLDLLRRTYAQKEDWNNLRRTFERMLPLIADPEMKREVQQAIEVLRQGPPPTASSVPAVRPETAEQEWTRVVERSLDETSTENRREGLQAFFGLLNGEGKHPGTPVPVPTAYFTRVHEAIEPDARCRAWLMRILGTAGGRGHAFLAMYAAFALYDPESEVRRTAAEALGEIGTPAGIVYLRQFLLLVPVGAQANQADEQEFNAARLGLVRLTGYEDVPQAAGAWLTGADAEASKARWLEWFRSPEGAEAVGKGIRDLSTIGELFPQRALVDLVNEPSFEISKAAYVGLLERSKGPPRGTTETPLEKQFWPRFPRLLVDDITPQSIQGARDAVNAWWGEWRKAREVSSAVGSPDGGSPGNG